MEEPEIMRIMIHQTIKELREKGKKELDFEWNFNFKNVNLIPVLELSNEGKNYETIEANEFSEKLQNLLREIYNLHNWINQEYGLKSSNEFLTSLKELSDECVNCERQFECSIFAELINEIKNKVS